MTLQGKACMLLAPLAALLFAGDLAAQMKDETKKQEIKEAKKEEPRKDTAVRHFGVSDEAGLFSKEAVEQAERDIASVDEKYKKSVLIETLKEGPSEKFLDWARERARQHKASGVYVVITTDPHKLEVLVDKQTRERKLFTQKNANELAALMLDRLKAGKKDEALTRGTQYIRKTFGDNVDATPDRPHSRARSVTPGIALLSVPGREPVNFFVSAAVRREGEAPAEPWGARSEGEGVRWEGEAPAEPPAARLQRDHFVDIVTRAARQEPRPPRPPNGRSRW